MTKGAADDSTLMYPQLVSNGRVSFESLCEEVAEQSSLTSGDIKNAVDRLIYCVAPARRSGSGLRRPRLVPHHAPFVGHCRRRNLRRRHLHAQAKGGLHPRQEAARGAGTGTLRAHRAANRGVRPTSPGVTLPGTGAWKHVLPVPASRTFHRSKYDFPEAEVRLSGNRSITI